MIVRNGFPVIPPSFGNVAEMKGMFLLNEKFANCLKSISLTDPIIRFILSRAPLFSNWISGRVNDLVS